MIPDKYYLPVEERMFERHSDEYELVHNGSGRSEEMPSQLQSRHRQEWKDLKSERKTIGIMEWLKRYNSYDCE